MINLIKSQPAPVCLANEKAKSNGNYRCGEVIERLKNDFHNKCYLCELRNPTTINVEHFIPHAGNRDLMFDWNNLFYVCGHCNNQKNILQNKKDFPILNCTNSEHQLLNWIEFDIKPFPKEKPKIRAIHQHQLVENTVTLLDEIYNGTHTPTKKQEAANLREILSEEVDFFVKCLCNYKTAFKIDEKSEYKRAIIRGLHPKKSAFTAFKIWVIKNNQEYLQEFGEYLNQTT